MSLAIGAQLQTQPPAAWPSAEGVPGVCEILRPAEQSLPLVLASPHSGSVYPADLVAQSALDPQTLRRSEDCYVDELMGEGPSLGAPLLRALFPRAYLDPNREPYELDPAMFEDRVPDFVNSASPRVTAGLGTIAKLVANGAEIYSGKLRFAEAERRIEALYRPYHRSLQGLIRETRDRFGYCILLDGHSMPSVGGPTEPDSGRLRVDFVLGDCYGTSCAEIVTETARRLLSDLGYRVQLNAPYAGGYTTRHYGRRTDRIHALQIEINRGLYMNETNFEKKPEFFQVAAHLARLLAALGALAPETLA